ncbi:hypothetical protein B0H11DRAFT_2201229 [Mycena galericulata]|nr:hypothetical protein B0H11DRAFT_2201229 [Mycena galericulata]
MIPNYLQMVRAHQKIWGSLPAVPVHELAPAVFAMPGRRQGTHPSRAWGERRGKDGLDCGYSPPRWPSRAAHGFPGPGQEGACKHKTQRTVRYEMETESQRSGHYETQRAGLQAAMKQYESPFSSFLARLRVLSSKTQGQCGDFRSRSEVRRRVGQIRHDGRLQLVHAIQVVEMRDRGTPALCQLLPTGKTRHYREKGRGFTAPRDSVDDVHVHVLVASSGPQIVHLDVLWVHEVLFVFAGKAQHQHQGVTDAAPMRASILRDIHFTQNLACAWLMVLRCAGDC